MVRQGVWLIAFSAVAVATAAIASCVSDDSTGGAGNAGTEGEPCLKDACLEGLTCVSNVCVRLDGAVSPGDANVPQIDGAGADSATSDAGGEAALDAAKDAGSAPDCGNLTTGPVNSCGQPLLYCVMAAQCTDGGPAGCDGGLYLGCGSKAECEGGVCCAFGSITPNTCPLSGVLQGSSCQTSCPSGSFLTCTSQAECGGTKHCIEAEVGAGIGNFTGFCY